MTGTPASKEALEGLALRVREGDDRAMGRLLRVAHPRVRRWALVKVGDPDDAEDVAQEVLLRVSRRLGSWDGRARFTTWLYAVTRNAALDLLSRRGRRAEAAGEATRSDPADARVTPAPADRIDDARAAELVRVFFEELPDRQREVFDLADLQGYAPVEIAGMLDVKPGTVRANLFKARRAIRERILAARPELVEAYGDDG